MILLTCFFAGILSLACPRDSGARPRRFNIAGSGSVFLGLDTEKERGSAQC